MNQNAINYLQQNKEKFTKEQLIDQLKKAGYSETDINESVTSVYAQKTSFWDFKVKKIYQNRNEKIIDFVVGFFGLSLVFSIINGIIFSVFSLNYSIASSEKPLLYIILLAENIIELMILIYLFKRRKFIFYGMSIHFAMSLFGTLMLLTASFIFKGML